MPNPNIDTDTDDTDEHRSIADARAEQRALPAPEAQQREHPHVLMSTMPGDNEVNIVRPFTFTYPDGSARFFAAGKHKVPDEVANHWYLRHHTDDPPPTAVVPGTPEWAHQEYRRTAQQASVDRAVEHAAEVARVETRERMTQEQLDAPPRDAVTRESMGLEGQQAAATGDPQAEEQVRNADAEADAEAGEDTSGDAAGTAEQRRASAAKRRGG